MRVLVGCEESQTVCGAFRQSGHEAYSCDFLATRGNPAWHIRGDVMDALSLKPWDLIILHPDCTALAVSGNAHYGKGMRYHEQRIDALEWTLNLWNIACSQCDHVSLENPVGVLLPHMKHVQYIQPWEFGHGETKKTGLALHGLPPLVPTKIVAGREQRILNMPPSPTRKRDRSKTYAGIAKAMAFQWGKHIQGG